MFENFLEKISELFSNENNSASSDYNDYSSDNSFQGIDLTQYSSEDIEEAMRSALETSENTHGCEISFGASPDVDARNTDKSTLLDKLSNNRIYVSQIYTDKLWGGLDSYSGDKVYDAINSARDNGKISSTVYNELISLLKKACHSQ